jgi:hypothetical protein
MSDHENEPDVDEPEADDEPDGDDEPNEGGRPIAEI